jgi:hypothetical protein
MHYDGPRIVAGADTRHADALVDQGLARWDTCGQWPTIHPTAAGLAAALPLVAADEATQRRAQDLQVADIVDETPGQQVWVVQSIERDGDSVRAQGRALDGQRAGATVRGEWQVQTLAERPSIYLGLRTHPAPMARIEDLPEAYAEAIDALLDVDARRDQHVRPWWYETLDAIRDAADAGRDPASALREIRAELHTQAVQYDNGLGDRNGTRTGLQVMAERLAVIAAQCDPTFGATVLGIEPAQRWRQICADVDPLLPDDPHYPALAAAMSRVEASGENIATLLPELARAAPLGEHPGRRLHERLIDVTEAALTPVNTALLRSGQPAALASSAPVPLPTAVVRATPSHGPPRR